MKALIALIVAMGIAILVALALVAYGIVSGGGRGGPAGFDQQDFALPAGCEIAEASLEGERVILRITGLAERGCQEVLIFDLESGAALGRITAKPGEARLQTE